MKLLRYGFDTKKGVGKGLEKIAKEGKLVLETTKKIGEVCISVFYLGNLITFYRLSKKFSHLPNLY